MIDLCVIYNKKIGSDNPFKEGIFIWHQSLWVEKSGNLTAKLEEELSFLSPMTPELNTPGIGLS